MTVYEGGIRVPAFAFHASLANQGSTNNEFLAIMDVMPTFLELANTSHPGETYEGREVAAVRGKSFLGLLRGDDAPVHGVTEAIGWSSGALIKGGWKLIRERTDAAEWGLYDLARDPSETTNLSETQPDVLADLLAEWDRFAEQTNL